MSTVNGEDLYNLDRKTASRLLKVSIRTIDRYIKAKKVSTNVVDGRIWLSKKELEELRDRSQRRISTKIVDMSTVKMSTDKRVDNNDKVEVIDQEDVNSVSTKSRKKSSSGTVYKKLYEVLKQEINEKQERLEIANYRVGQLEAQVKNSIPMLEYHREKFEREKKEKNLRDEMSEKNNLIKKIIRQIKYEKFSKRIFIAALLIILALQPLWLLFLYK